VSYLRRAEDHPFFDNGGRPIGFAHRGGALYVGSIGLENSMLAFEAAVKLGFQYLETDVTTTSDGVLLAFHDKRLNPLSDLAGVVADLPYETVQRARLGGREPIPQLSEVLTAWPDVRLNIDCKVPNAMEPLARAIEQHRAWDRVCLASFSMRSLGRLRRRLGPRIATSYSKAGVAALHVLPTEPLRRLAVGSPGLAAQVPPSWSGIRVLTQRFIDRAHALGKHVHVWTVDDPADMRRFLDMGVDGIFRPSRRASRRLHRPRHLAVAPLAGTAPLTGPALCVVWRTPPRATGRSQADLSPAGNHCRVSTRWDT
jgi:glycerophosphoryl diester phosphodiesterase